MHRFFWMFRRIDRRKLLSIAFDFPSRMDSNNIKAHDILFGIESVCLSVCLLIGKLGKLHQNDRNAHKLNKQLISISSVTWSIRKGKVWLEWAQHLATHTNIIVNIRMHARMQHNLMGFSVLVFKPPSTLCTTQVTYKLYGRISNWIDWLGGFYKSNLGFVWMIICFRAIFQMACVMPNTQWYEIKYIWVSSVIAKDLNGDCRVLLAANTVQWKVICAVQ